MAINIPRGYDDLFLHYYKWMRIGRHWLQTRLWFPVYAIRITREHFNQHDLTSQHDKIIYQL